MRRLAAIIVAAVTWSQGLLVAQSGDVNKILADARQALGGDKKLAALKTLAATGQAVRVTGDTSSPPADVEMAFELPDRFMKKDVLAAVMNSVVTRTSGFNGDQPIDVVDQPPTLGGNVVIRFGGPGAAPPGAPQTPEQEEAARKAKLLAARQEFARLTLGILAGSTPAYPLEFAFAGQAESPDGKADIVDVKGEGNFAVRLFIDTKTHLPLMLSWMGREPLQINRVVGGPGRPGGANVVLGGAGTHATSSGHAATMTPEEMEKARQQAMEQVKQAEENRRTVEFRIYYGDYRDVDGVKVPFTLQRSIDGKPSEQVTFEKVKINGKIDPKKFETR